MNTFKVVRMAKRGDKLPHEFKTEWVELNGQLKRAANRVVVGVPTNDAPAFDALASIYYSTAAKAKDTLTDKAGRQEVLCEEILSGEKPDAARRSTSAAKPSRRRRRSARPARGRPSPSLSGSGPGCRR